MRITSSIQQIFLGHSSFGSTMRIKALTSLSLLWSVSLNPGSKSVWLLTSSKANLAAGMHACPPCQPPFPAIGKIPPICSWVALFDRNRNIVQKTITPNTIACCINRLLSKTVLDFALFVSAKINRGDYHRESQ